MKKILCASVLAGLCSAVTFAADATGDISSSNCVGFMIPGQLREGNSLVGPMFTGVGQQTEGSGSYSVQDIVPTAIGDSKVPDGKDITGTAAITLQVLSSTGGGVGDVLFWRDCTIEGARGKLTTYKGWYNGVGTKSELKITTGQALWLYMPSGAKCSITFSGEVPSGDIYMMMNQNNTAICNPQPKTFGIQEIKPYAIEGKDVPEGKDITGSAAITLQKLSATGGGVGDVLFWRNCTVEGARGKITVYNGWYNGVGELSEITLEPGEGVWVYSPNDFCALLFPSALTTTDAE